MYQIQDRIREVQFELDPKSLPQHEDILSCRSHGTDLCDGFVCQAANDCQSGCCGNFGSLKQDYCQPLVDGACPTVGFKYGFYGNKHPELKSATEAEPQLSK
jgi:hypothetical protein